MMKFRIFYLCTMLEIGFSYDGASVLCIFKMLRNFSEDVIWSVIVSDCLFICISLSLKTNGAKVPSKDLN